MVTGEILKVGIPDVITGADDQCRTELVRAPSRAPLAVAALEALGCGNPGRRGNDRPNAELFRSGDLGGRSLFVEQNRERDPLIFNEGLGVAPATGTDGGHARPGGEDLFVSVADLTGPLATGQSAEMAEEQDHLRLGGPTVSEAMLVAFGPDEHLVG